MMVDTAEWYPPLVCISWKLCFHFNLFFLLPQYWALLFRTWSDPICIITLIFLPLLPDSTVQ